MFKPLFLVFVFSVAFSLAIHIDTTVEYHRAPDTTWAVDAVDCLEQAYTSFWPHRYLVAEAWNQLFVQLHVGIYDVVFGKNFTVISNSTVLIAISAWEHPQGITLVQDNVTTTEPPVPPPEVERYLWTIAKNAAT